MTRHAQIDRQADALWKQQGICLRNTSCCKKHLVRRWFGKLDQQRKAEEEARDLQFKKDAFWARRGRGQRTTISTARHTEPPRMRRSDVRAKLLFRAVMKEDLAQIRSLVKAGVRWQSTAG